MNDDINFYTDEEIALPNGMVLSDNGALQYATTGDNTLNLFASFAAYRDKPVNQILNTFKLAFAENKTVALRILFYFRDVRNGQKEKRIFQTVLNWLGDNESEWLINNFDLIPLYGYWKDMWHLHGAKSFDAVLDYINKQLTEDAQLLNDGKQPSLLAKWIPSENSNSVQYKAIYQAIMIKRYGKNISTYHRKQYRKLIVSLRNHLNIVEQSMSAKEWNDINYERVAAVAMRRYKDVFKRHTPYKWENYMAAVAAGTAKINVGSLTVVDIMTDIITAKDRQAGIAQWNAMPKQSINALAVIDVSGSMDSGSGAIPPITAATALGIYIAENNEADAFRNLVLLFSNRTLVIEFNESDDVYGKYSKLMKTRPVANTNIASVFQFILTTAIKNNVAPDKLPKSLVFVSDMQFDQGSDNRYTNYEDWKRQFNKAGYNLPHIIYWNVSSKSVTYEVNKDTVNTVLVNGYSASILTKLMDTLTLTPLQAMVKMLSRYEHINY